jgi:hypothetical protein
MHGACGKSRSLPQFVARRRQETAAWALAAEASAPSASAAEAISLDDIQRSAKAPGKAKAKGKAAPAKRPSAGAKAVPKAPRTADLLMTAKVKLRALRTQAESSGMAAFAGDLSSLLGEADAATTALEQAAANGDGVQEPPPARREKQNTFLPRNP